MDNVKACPLCDRVYSQETRFLRHVRYCRRAKDQRKGRPKSCVACNASKVKCTFSSPCSRCDRKGLRCIYGDVDSASLEDGREKRRQLRGHYQQRDEATKALSWGQGAGEEEGTVSLDVVPRGNDELGGMAWTDASWLEYATTSGSLDTIDLPISFESLTDSRSVVEFEALPPALKVPLTSQHTSFTQPSANLPQQHHSPVTSTDLTHLRHGNPVHKYAASLIMHIICAFPEMMLRRQTLPPFIHPRWHEAELPEPIASCMGIAQLFASRTPETRGFLWRTIFAEEQRFLDEYMAMSAIEIHHALQAIVIYMIMAVVDRDADTPRRGARLVQTAGLISSRFRALLKGEYYSMSEHARPSATWEDWIFAESRRRATCLWYTLSRIIALDAEIPCEGCPPLDDLPLVSGRALWEARSREEWLAEKALHESKYPIATLGDLTGCRRRSGGGDAVNGVIVGGNATPFACQPSTHQRLASWEAGGDKMVVMMNIVADF